MRVFPQRRVPGILRPEHKCRRPRTRRSRATEGEALLQPRDDDSSPTPPFQLTDPDETFADRLRRLRQDRGLSQRELAAGSGVSYAYVSRLEAATRRPSVRAIRAIARRLGVTPEQLESGIDLTPTDLLELRLTVAALAPWLGAGAQDSRAELLALREDARAGGDEDLVTRTELALGRAALEAGDHPAAAEWLEQAATSPVAAPAGYPDAHTGLARARFALGRRAAAFETVQNALAALDDPGPDDATARVLLLACAVELETEAGDLAGAQTELARVAAALRTIGPDDRARTATALARKAWAAGRHRTGARELRRAQTLLATQADRSELGRATLVCAQALVWEGEPDAARFLTTEAAALLHEGEATDGELGLVQALEAIVDAEDDPARALLLAEEAESRLEDDPAGRGVAAYAAACSRAAAGDIAAAEISFHAATDALEKAGRYREASVVSRNWSRMLRAAGEAGRALDVADRAAGLTDRASSHRNGGSA
ncbi:MAG TPA: helix-turn-helix domain-containing protein [Gaiellaceae bacterium]|nr:helix-turn-helix domain-containing protein [Gaiellaceae bacterium]